VRRPLTVIILAALLAGACAPPAPPAPQPFATSFPTPEAMATEVLARVTANDRAALEALALTEREFLDVVWPELPAARPERNLPADYVWGQQRQRSRQSLGQLLARFGGRRMTLVAVTFTGGVTDYATYRVHRDSELRVRTDDGAETTVRLFGSAIERAGAFKVYSFAVD
jgi:hypothetical protein